MYAVTLADIEAAARRIADLIRRTPVMTCASLDRLAGCQLFFKCEQWQKSGAFKFRGASNAVRRLTSERRARGVVTHSSGNHAQALALAARLHGIPAYMVMPQNAAAIKRQAVIEYGGLVTLCEPNLLAREQTAAQVQAETGAMLIPPYNHADVIAGQGTVALELLAQVPDLDAIIAPIGGGGLMAGICLAARGLRPDIRIFGAEPAGADDAARSLSSGRLLPQTDPRTMAEGLLTSLGDLTWPVIRDNVERIFTVREDEIVSALRLMAERAKLLIEPSAAVAVAAVLGEEFKQVQALKKIGIVLSGGNVAAAW